MQHVELKPADLDMDRHWECARPMRLVHVPTDDERGRQVAKRIDHFGSPDVTGVDDEVRPPERRDRLWPKQSVGIRDYPNEDFVSEHDPARFDDEMCWRGSRFFSTLRVNQSLGRACKRIRRSI